VSSWPSRRRPLAAEVPDTFPPELFAAFSELGLPMSQRVCSSSSRSSSASRRDREKSAGQSHARHEAAAVSSSDIVLHGGDRDGSAEGQGAALYFVDALAHRTLARCTACGSSLAGESTDGEALAPCVLGYRLALAVGAESRVGWAHARPHCLDMLGLPPLSPDRVASDVVFSRAVAEEQKVDILQSLTSDRAGAGGGGRRRGIVARSRRRRPLQVERWSHAAAASSHWGGPIALLWARAAGARVQAEVRLHPMTLEADAWESMRQCGGAVPLCVICMQDFVVGETIVRLPCAHIFHADCASEWLRHKPVCPLDKVPVVEEISAF